MKKKDTKFGFVILFMRSRKFLTDPGRERTTLTSRPTIFRDTRNLSPTRSISPPTPTQTFLSPVVLRSSFLPLPSTLSTDPTTSQHGELFFPFFGLFVISILSRLFWSSLKGVRDVWCISCWSGRFLGF